MSFKKTDTSPLVHNAIQVTMPAKVCQALSSPLNQLAFFYYGWQDIDILIASIKGLFNLPTTQAYLA